RVMEGAGTPTLLLPPGASPHGYALRPSEARALSNADIVVWIGPALTPWLERSLDTLAEGATQVVLMEAPGIEHLPLREGPLFEHDHGAHHGEHDDEHDHDEHAHGDDDHDHGEKHAHDDHGHEDHGHDDHGHEEADHDEHEGHGHDHEEHAEHDDEHDHDDGHGHGHGHTDARDAHIWLNPANAAQIAEAVAAALAKADPAQAALYTANAAAAAAEYAALAETLATTVQPVAGRPFVVLHDAYQHFEHRFGTEAAGAIAAGDGGEEAGLSPARLAALQERIGELEAVCVFAEPQFPNRTLTALTEGTAAKTGVLDPLGADLEPGAALYTGLLEGLATSLVECLG
ncbi:MAG: zinc ABC transporter substrate-binding protein, partial [Pseudomonadota bacterium]